MRMQPKFDLQEFKRVTRQPAADKSVAIKMGYKSASDLCNSFVIRKDNGSGITPKEFYQIQEKAAELKTTVPSLITNRAVMQELGIEGAASPAPKPAAAPAKPPATTTTSSTPAAKPPVAKAPASPAPKASAAPVSLQKPAAALAKPAVTTTTSSSPAPKAPPAPATTTTSSSDLDKLFAGLSNEQKTLLLNSAGLGLPTKTPPPPPPPPPPPGGTASRPKTPGASKPSTGPSQPARPTGPQTPDIHALIAQGKRLNKIVRPDSQPSSSSTNTSSSTSAPQLLPASVRQRTPEEERQFQIKKLEKDLVRLRRAEEKMNDDKRANPAKYDNDLLLKAALSALLGDIKETVENLDRLRKGMNIAQGDMSQVLNQIRNGVQLRHTSTDNNTNTTQS